MLFQKHFWGVLVVLVVIIGGSLQTVVEGRPHRILLDTDVDTDDFFALLYLLKLNRSEFQLEVSSWSIIHGFVLIIDHVNFRYILKYVGQTLLHFYIYSWILIGCDVYLS